MTNDAVPRRGRSGVRVFGMLGLVFCLILALGILWGRAWLADQVDGVFDSIDQAVGRGTTVVAQTTGRLEERVADIDGLLTDLSGVVGTASVPQAVADRAASIADRFAQIRDGWVEFRARIDAALETLAQLDRALPFVDIPTGPTEELAALDQRVEEISASVNGLRASAATTVQAVIDGATGLRRVVGGVADVAGRLETGLAAVQDRVDRARSTIDTVMWLTTATLLLLVAYIAILNVLIVRGAGRDRRPPDDVPIPAVDAT